MAAYKIRNAENGFMVKSGGQISVFEYDEHDGEGVKEQDKGRAVYVGAESRMLEYMSKRLQAERKACPSHKLTLKIVWVV